MSQGRKGRHLQRIGHPVQKAEQQRRDAEGNRLLFPVPKSPVKEDRINGREQGPVAEQGREHQKRHQQVPGKAVCGPVARLQDQEAEKQRKQHVQHAKLQGSIGDLRDQGEDEKTQGVFFSGMGIAVALHQKEAHRHRRKVSFSSGMIGFLLFQAFFFFFFRPRPSPFRAIGRKPVVLIILQCTALSKRKRCFLAA